MHSFPSRLPALATGLLLGALAGCAPDPAPLTLEEALDSLSLEDFVAHMEALSDDALAGRLPGTPGYDSAAAYVAREAAALGLEPGGTGGGWLQPITFRRTEVDPEAASFAVDGTTLRYGPDFAILASRTPPEVELEAPLVFAGFGIHAPWLGYDDLDGLDVAGKVVVVLPGAPESLGSVEQAVLPSGPVRDAELQARGALATVVAWPEGGTGRGREWADMRDGWARPGVGWVPPPAGEAGGPGADAAGRLASLAVPERVAAAWMSRVGRDVDEVRARLVGGTPTSFALEGRARISARLRSETFESANVAALLPGTDPALRAEHLVVTAHLDHVGTGPAVAGDTIYNGTLDNASGSAALLELASVLTRMEPPRRSVLFLWVTAEESGLLGSDYFARFPTLGEGRMVANQNVDGVMGMIAAASDMLAFGYEHSNLSEAVDFAVARTGTPVSPDPTPDQNLFIRSDQYAFVRQGVPAIWVQSGRTALDPEVDAQAELDRWIAERYHRPADDPAQPVDRAGVRAELEANLLVAWYIAHEMEEIRWSGDSFLYRLFTEDDG